MTRIVYKSFDVFDFMKILYGLMLYEVMNPVSVALDSSPLW